MSPAKSLVMIELTDDESDPLTPAQWSDYNERVHHELIGLSSFGLRSMTYQCPTDDERRSLYVGWIQESELPHLRERLTTVRQWREIHSIGLAVIPNMELL